MYLPPIFFHDSVFVFESSKWLCFIILIDLTRYYDGNTCDWLFCSIEYSYITCHFHCNAKLKADNLSYFIPTKPTTISKSKLHLQITQFCLDQNLLSTDHFLKKCHGPQGWLHQQHYKNPNPSCLAHVPISPYAWATTRKLVLLTKGI